MLVNALFLFLMFRCSTDILSPEKGDMVVALYVIMALGLTAIKVQHLVPLAGTWLFALPSSAADS